MVGKGPNPCHVALKNNALKGDRASQNITVIIFVEVAVKMPQYQNIGGWKELGFHILLENQCHVNLTSIPKIIYLYRKGLQRSLKVSKILHR
jgi:hypothetical protein